MLYRVSRDGRGWFGRISTPPATAAMSCGPNRTAATLAPRPLQDAISGVRTRSRRTRESRPRGSPRSAESRGWDSYRDYSLATLAQPAGDRPHWSTLLALRHHERRGSPTVTPSRVRLRPAPQDLHNRWRRMRPERIHRRRRPASKTGRKPAHVVILAVC